MTSEERLQKIEENLLVQSRLQANTDRALAEFKDEVREWIKHTEEWNGQIQGWVTKAEARITQLEAISTAVLERWDRFLRGHEGDGQK
jgi:hypothetical protein